MKICTPHEHLWKPPLRKAAGTLSASGESAVDKDSGLDLRVSRFERIFAEKQDTENAGGQ
jgi:hypothetical protein